jgi:hypothetical protein
MARSWWVMVVSLPGLIGQSPEAVSQAKGKTTVSFKYALTKVPIKKGSLRMGLEDRRDPPEVGWQAKVGTDTFIFFDLAEHDKLESDIDGMAMPPYPFIVAIPEKLLLKTGQYKVTFEGEKSLILELEDLGPVQALVADASILTELRIRGGLRPLALDRAGSADCDKHCDYLKRNRIADGSGGLGSHEESESNPGYTPEGAAAGKASNLAFSGSFRTDVTDWYSSVWHAVPMFDPGLREIGIALRNGVGMMYFTKREGFQEQIIAHPVDKAIGIPRTFSENGENPNPVPGTQGGTGCGFPILIRLVPPYRELVSAEVTDASGKAIAGTKSSPAKPATPQWPTNSNCAAFVPSKPLAPNMTYHVKFTFAEEAAPVTWTFTTGK